jgi:hypothetical protein
MYIISISISVIIIKIIILGLGSTNEQECDIWPFEDSLMKPTKHYLKDGGRGTGIREWKCNGGFNVFKVHCTHIWNYHNKIPLYY